MPPATTKDDDGGVPQYHKNLKAPIATVVGREPHAPVHAAEIAKVRAGLPVEINPSVGSGYKVMDWLEYFGRFKTSPEFPDCLHCGGPNTKEHYFTQTWCRGKRDWAAESVCLDCLRYSHRAYRDPDYQTPEEFEKARWTALVAEQAALDARDAAGSDDEEDGGEGGGKGVGKGGAA